MEVARHKLLVDANRGRDSHFIAKPFQDIHDIGAVQGEPRLLRRREAREDVGDREHPELAPGCQLVMDKVHRPDLVGSRRRQAVIAQLGLDPALWRFVTQLQAPFAIDAAVLVLAVTPSFAAQ